MLANVSQEAVYNSCAHEVVESAISGLNSTIFAYGQVSCATHAHTAAALHKFILQPLTNTTRALLAQTGAGKTFTMAGDLRNYNHRGLIPRAIHHLFNEIDMRVDRIYKVQASPKPSPPIPPAQVADTAVFRAFDNF